MQISMRTSKEICGWRTRLYVGAPNTTHRLSVKYVKKIHSWAASVKLTNYTLLTGKGYWNGNEEGTAIIEYMGPPIKKCKVRALKDTLRQDAILLTVDKVRSTVV